MRNVFKYLAVGVVIVLVFVAGYLGYLSALVDVDRYFVIEQASASREAEILEQQAKRLESIIAARKRALLKRRNDLVKEARVSVDVEKSVPTEVLVVSDRAGIVPPLSERVVEDREVEFESRNVTYDEVSDKSDGFNAEERELQALEDQYAVVKNRQKRLEVEERNLEANSTDVQVSPFLNKLGRIVDKRREIVRSTAEESVSPYERVDFSALSGVDIAVQDKTGSGRDLEGHHKQQMALALSVMPSGFDRKVSRIYMVYGGLGRRGLSGYTSKGVVVFFDASQQDLTNVAFHEFGHVVGLSRTDDGGARSSFTDGDYVFAVNDPMVKFFGISWRDDYDKKAASGFVSDYALSSIHEDFAEAFIFYITHGVTFRNMLQGNAVFAEKYGFMQEVFRSVDFNTGVASLFATPYDVTLLRTDLNAVLDSLL